MKGIIYKKKANPDKSLKNYSRALQIYEELGHCKSIIKVRNNLANFYNSISSYDQAIEQYKSCLTFLNQCPNQYQKAIITRNLAGLYFNYEKKSEKGIEYFNEALIQFKTLESTPKINNLIIGIYNELTFLNLQNKKITEAKNNSILAQKLINTSTPVHLLYNHKLNNAKLHFVNNESRQGKKILDEIDLLIKNNSGLQNYKVGFLIELAEYYISNKQFEKALNKLSIAEKLAESQLKTEILSNVLMYKSEIYEKTGNLNKSLLNLKRSIELRYKTFNEENSLIIQNNKFQIENIKKDNQYRLEKHRQNEKLQKSIIVQEKLENSNLRISILAVSTIIILLIFIFIIYSQRKKISIKKLKLESKNRALELELNNKNLDEDYKLFQNTMAAKKEEQNRISRNLHDNIGANLAAIKLALDGEKDKAFTDLIDDVYQEVRNLSYELSESKGLFKQMIHTYLKNIEIATGLNIHYEVFPDVDMENIYSVKKREIFSIVREVVQNVIKHSKSEHMEVIFSKENDYLHIYMEDFGLGFDEKEVKLGLGLSNIKKRVSLLNGNFDIDARVNRGVIININIPIL